MKVRSGIVREKVGQRGLWPRHVKSECAGFDVPGGEMVTDIVPCYAHETKRKRTFHVAV